MTAPKTLKEKQDFLQRLVDNREVILQEYLNNLGKRTIAIPGYDESSTPIPEWRAVALWWDHKPWPIYQKWFPKSTELIREGPTHRASGWLILKPHSRTPTHNHIDWGNKIIMHLPMMVPEGDVGFWVDGEIHRWQVGKLFAFDITKEHYGFNNTDQERAIFVLDFDADEWHEALRPYMSLETTTQ
jgi:aspartyl/asparaginyl beta-hydroxylase (cupin superfamily)